jgi:hypothetical protein
MRSFRIVFGTCAAILTLTNAAAVAGNPGVAPIDSTPYGLTYGEWSALQWQWLYSMPVDGHPLFETADCSENQMDHVWFLGGTFAAIEIEPGIIVGMADRDCTMPSGTALFFPLIDVECSTIEGNGETEAELRDCANFFADFIDPSTVFLEVDGQPMDVEFHRAESPLFEYGPLPDNNVLQLFGLDAPEGSTTPAVSDGYWAMLAPLSVGTHTVTFGGVADYTSIGGPVFIQDIMYTITVVPRGRY